MGGVLGILLAFAFLLVAGPVGASALGHPLGAMSTIIMVGFGIGLMVLCGTLLVITRLYVKTRADEAFVRTGMGKLKIIKDGGALVIPVVHQKVLVPLRTFRLEVMRRGADALLTLDKLRADIKAEFFIRVMPSDEDIVNAARSLGERTEHDTTIRALIEDKLVSALRTVAATRTLEDLNSKRDEFVKSVVAIVTADLKHNGFTLETATISALDQADAKALRDDNVFDAEGLLTVARITQDKLTERNQIQRQRERERLAQDVDARKQMLGLEQERATAEAAQQAEIAKARAKNDQEAKEKEIAAAKAIDIAGVEKEKQVAVAKQQSQQAAEVADRERQKAIADAEKARAGAEAELAKAEATRERERQAVKTVEVEAAAEREKKKVVIEAQAAAECRYVEKQRDADAEAYKLKADAEARKAAAEADAEAIQKRAAAEAEAAKKRAEGAKAEQMVPVSVEGERVTVEQRRVNEVLVPELKAREEHGRVAQDFELAKFRIQQEATVCIEAAKATATLGGKVEAQVFGTPEDVARMSRAWMRGMGVARTVDGFFAGASDGTERAVNGAGHTVAALLAAVIKRLGVTPAEIEAAKKELVAKADGDPETPAAE